MESFSILEMKRLSLIYVCFAFLSPLIIAPINSFALPFSKSPNSYQNWLNQKKWKGDKINFIQLDSCFYMNPEHILRLYREVRGVELNFNSRVYMEGYSCRSGFVEILNPQGKKICVIDEIEFIQQHPISSLNEPEINFKYKDCRWKS
jgi:hypothetical protein